MTELDKRSLMADELSRITDEEEEEEDTVDMEDEEEKLVQMKKGAQLIQKYRSTIPDRLKDRLSSSLIAQRPLVYPSSSPISQSDDRNSESIDAEEDDEIAEKIEFLKKKISSKVSAFPTLLKRVNDSTSRFDKLDSYNINIHPAWKKKRTS